MWKWALLYFLPKVSIVWSSHWHSGAVVTAFPQTYSIASFLVFFEIPGGGGGHSAVHSTFPWKYLWGSFLCDNAITPIISPLSVTELYLFQCHMIACCKGSDHNAVTFAEGKNGLCTLESETWTKTLYRYIFIYLYVFCKEQNKSLFVVIFQATSVWSMKLFKLKAKGRAVNKQQWWSSPPLAVQLQELS